MPVSEGTLTALRRVGEDYAFLVGAATPDELLGPTRGTRWTNRELLFHMWFGQHLVRVFIPLFGGFARLPRPVSVGYARLLEAATRPYHWVNFAGPVAGVRAVRLRRAASWMAADTDWLLRWARSASDAQLAAGMAVPAKWDPYFRPWMSRADVLDWAPRHYAHHRAQLTLAAADERAEGSGG
ncbi:DinB family protein [Tessaracoccus oleiagri]|uniref:DinB superfamily protein n=1 Tax=Tessaracoccus oleiagri TaxID=686624 RepID=A0A1G9L018_9ACTN|nr:DinB family protein [Tessaracoccus oleiagri]SDL55460.1 DinB superfamily protein [Tessaracoccus oleiagri]